MTMTIPRIRRRALLAGLTLLAAAPACSGNRPQADQRDAGAACAPNAERKLDLLFVMDDTLAPEGLRFRAALPHFFQALGADPEGLPDLHVAVVTTSMGAGAFENVTGCTPIGVGDLDGAFQAKTGCGVRAGQGFLTSERGATNFDGEIADVVGCIANVGQGGCGFRQPFAAVRRGLERAGQAGDPINAGFLRPEAHLAIVIVTNGDDCSVSPDSTLFDPNQYTIGTSLGGLSSYRCAEFGHLCDGRPPPHTVAERMGFKSCTPAEGRGRLTTVASFISFLRTLKPDHDERVFLGALAGPPTPYAVVPRTVLLPDGTTEIEPRVDYSCVNASTTEYAYPAVRIAAAVSALQGQSAFETMCPEDDYDANASRIAVGIRTAVLGPCPPPR